METVRYLILAIQPAVYLFICYQYLRKSAFAKQSNVLLIIISVFVSFLMLICFSFAHNWKGQPHIFPHEGLLEFTLISIVALAFYWLVRIPIFLTNPLLRIVSYTLLGTLFWIAVLTSFKFFPILLWSLFPFYGLLIAAPFLVLGMITSEIIFISKQPQHFSFGIIILFGFGFLLFFQVIMNLWSPEPWELIRQFSLNYDFF